MTRFLILIYGDEQRWAAASAEWNQQNGEAHRRFLTAAGGAVLTGGEVLPSSSAVTIRGDRPGEPTTGPFVQADRGIGGYYVVEAADLDAAVELARGIPEASHPDSGVEIRQMP